MKLDNSLQRPRILRCRATDYHLASFAYCASLFAAGLCGTGCAGTNSDQQRTELFTPPRVIVVAPVLNLSGTPDVDVLKISDSLASEFLSFPRTTVVPINLTLARLAQSGKRRVESPDDAVALARSFGADATVVLGITEYDPYNPPVIGMVMQWYDARLHPSDSVASDASSSPRLQTQRVFNAAADWVQSELREFYSARNGDDSPYGWRLALQSQQTYVRYCCWSMIRTMFTLAGPRIPAAASREIDS